jgi:DNA-binding NarL/FixJ family response regulator
MGASSAGLLPTTSGDAVFLAIAFGVPYATGVAMRSRDRRAHELARRAETQPDIEVVGEAGDGVEAVALARELRPDVVLVDIRMPRMDGLEATRVLAAEPDLPRILVLTTCDADAYVYEAMKAGASGFLLKDLRPEELARAVRDRVQAVIYAYEAGLVEPGSFASPS